MFQNFKTDIIYYNTPADFELEFNLCGCCRMRLLNDKCSDKKSLLLSLSRAVSRSRVIIITAPLFDDENITKTIATAIGSNIQTIDNTAFGINSDAKINIIKNATPLVTADGIFGGCIIESGPQTLILLTDSKSVRKTIMKTLIHPYIEEISTATPSAQVEEQIVDHEQILTDSDDESLPDANQEEPVTDDLKDMLVTETDDSVTEEYSEPNDEHDQNEQLIFETDAESESDPDEYYYSDQDLLFTETAQTHTPYHLHNQDQDDDDYESDYYIEEAEQKGNKAFNIWLLVISIILLLAIAVLCFCIFFVPAESGTTPAAYLQEIFGVMFN